MKEPKPTACVFLKKNKKKNPEAGEWGIRPWLMGLEILLLANKMIITIIIQVLNQGKQMASVCYHPFYRRQRLRSLWY